MVRDDPFELLGLDPDAPWDRAAIEAQYLEKSAALHPDRALAVDGPGAGAAATEQAARVNEAYRQLRDPVGYLEARLRARHGVALDPAPTGAAPAQEFLVELLERQERAEAASARERAALAPEVETELAERVTRARAALADGRPIEAASALLEIRYLRRLLATLEAD